MIVTELHIVNEFLFTLGWLLGIIASITNEKNSRNLQAGFSKNSRDISVENHLVDSIVLQTSDEVFQKLKMKRVDLDTELTDEVKKIVDDIYKSGFLSTTNNLESYLNVLSNYTECSDYTSCRCFIYVDNFKDYLKVTQIIFLNLTLALKKLLELTQLSINTTFHYYITSTRNLLQNFFLIISNKGFYTTLHIHDHRINNFLYIYYLFIQHLGKGHEKLIPI